jgi:hypothetical protein
MDFVSELVRKRGKENLQKFIQFVVEIFQRYIYVFILCSTMCVSKNWVP